PNLSGRKRVAKHSFRERLPERRAAFGHRDRSTERLLCRRQRPLVASLLRTRLCATFQSVPQASAPEKEGQFPLIRDAQIPSRGPQKWRKKRGFARLLATYYSSIPITWTRWRSGRDSNPRYAFDVYSLSRRAPSTTRPPLRMLWTGEAP